MHLRRNVLIFHAGALGDFVLNWPLALGLARIHPQSRIVYVTHGQKGALAERVLRIESADIETGWHALFGDASGLSPAARKLLDGAHSIYSLIASPDDAWSGRVRSVAPDADLCCLRPRPTEAEGAVHCIDHLLAQLAPRKAVHEAVRQTVRFITDRGLAAGAGASKGIAIHPGSGSAAKCWPRAHFLELCRRLRADGLDVRVLLGEVELERWPAAERSAFGEVAEIREPKTYLELMEELVASECFAGNDSGPGHLAAILGVPTFTLFGPTDPAVWRPTGPSVQALRHMPLEALEPQTVHEWMMRERSL